MESRKEKPKDQPSTEPAAKRHQAHEHPDTGEDYDNGLFCLLDALEKPKDTSSTHSFQNEQVLSAMASAGQDDPDNVGSPKSESNPRSRKNQIKRPFIETFKNQLPQMVGGEKDVGECLKVLVNIHMGCEKEKMNTEAGRAPITNAVGLFKIGDRKKSFGDGKEIKKEDGVNYSRQLIPYLTIESKRALLIEATAYFWLIQESKKPECVFYASGRDPGKWADEVNRCISTTIGKLDKLYYGDRSAIRQYWQHPTNPESLHLITKDEVLSAIKRIGDSKTEWADIAANASSSFSSSSSSSSNPSSASSEAAVRFLPASNGLSTSSSFVTGTSGASFRFFAQPLPEQVEQKPAIPAVSQQTISQINFLALIQQLERAQESAAAALQLMKAFHLQQQLELQNDKGETSTHQSPGSPKK